MPTPAPLPQTFDGWARRPRGRWRRLVTGAATDREALAALRELTAGELAVDLCALVSGKHPNEPLGQGGTRGKRSG